MTKALQPDRRRTLGATLKHVREARALSVSDLARSSGIAKATLSALEAGSGNPTLETLWALTAALGVGLSELLEAQAPVLTVVRAGQGTVVRGDAVVARLVQSFDAGPMRVEMFTAEVRKRKQISPAHARGVTEHLVVTAGRLRVGPLDAPVELGPGDYLRMAPAWPHVYEGLEAGTSLVLTMHYPRG